jgi:tetratricopeptide (TPR) repeat protein
LHDYDRALQLAPRLAEAALNRGLLHYQEKRYPQAAANLELALKLGIDPAVGSYNLALIHLAQGDGAAALESLQEAVRHNPGHKEARELRERLERARR